MLVTLILVALIDFAFAFQCSPDTILRMATDKRMKQLERECHLAKTGEPQCETKSDVENAWNEFTKLEQQYKEAVTDCRATAKKLKRSKRAHIRRHTMHLTNPETVGKKVQTESERFDAAQPIRTKRQLCKTQSSQQLSQLAQDFSKHCERDNICLPDEDLPEGPQRDRFKMLYGSRAKKYAAYLTQLSLCYGRLT